jgi:hypothetical protein
MFMKKRTNKIFLLMAFASVFSFSGRAQETLSLPQLIDRVLTENYQVKIVRNEALLAANNNTLGNAGFLPTLDIQATNSNAANNTHQELFNGRCAMATMPKAKHTVPMPRSPGLSSTALKCLPAR